MLIDALIEFYDQNANSLPPLYHRFYQVGWLLELDRDGRFRQLNTTDVEIVMPMSNRTSGVLSHLIVDGADYILGLDSKTKRLNAYQDRLDATRQVISDPALDALHQFFKDDIQPEKAREKAKAQGIKPKDILLPIIDGVWLATKKKSTPTDLQRNLHDVWLQFMKEEYGSGTGICSICGRKDWIQDRHAKASVFGQYTSLVNMEKNAYMSHGLQNSANAPMCVYCVGKYVIALAQLADKENKSNRLITRTVKSSKEQSGWLAWLRQNNEGFTFDFAKQSRPEKAMEALRSIYKSQPYQIQHTDFYAAALTVSDKRISVRSFLTLSLKEAIERIEGYFKRHTISVNGEPRTFSAFSLLDAASPLIKNKKTGKMEPDRNKLPPVFADALIEHILTPRALPTSLLDATLRRCRVERDVPPARAALLKLYLRSTKQPAENMATENLNEKHPNPAYHCGRLLAVGDSVYYATTESSGYVSKRYYSSASTAPASVFGRIIPNVRHQLNVLQRKKPGYAVNLDKLMTQIHGRVKDSFPKTLPAVDQAIFALGFYHQRDHLMTSNNE